jgi:hypothetical protein
MIINIDEFIPFFPKRQFDLEKKKTHHKRKKHFKRTSDFDKLFFNVLVMTNNCSVLKYDRNVEKIKKIEILEKIQNINSSNKRIEKVSNNIMDDNAIDINTLDIIAQVCKLNIILYDDRCYYKMQYGTKETFYCIDWNYNLCEKGVENMKFITENKYEIQNIQKPYYSITHYKVEDLKGIARCLNLSLSEKSKKKDYFDVIKQYFENSIFNMK